MPTQNFFNLPLPKQSNILAAARKEFSRVTFNEASINKIISDAEISRGSFYLYFKDKKDLVYYLVSEYVAKMVKNAADSLSRSDGDIFEIFIEMYDTTLEYKKTADCDTEVLKNLFYGMHSNSHSPAEDIDMQEMLGFVRQESGFLKIIASIDAKKLNVQSDSDLNDLFALLLSVTRQSISKALGQMYNSQESRVRFLNMINMIKYGVLKPHEEGIGIREENGYEL